ncbi:hypothetical protein [Desulfotomaculum sp. 1211_IL3151]|uniref:hypothetical protein n=1 Tax=Desulfotomaculum sp. 1211_IL3151 TaxID=3084055 RepID=UPI002FD9FF73
MSGAIGDDEVNDLDALLTKRQELMGQVDELDQQISLSTVPENKQIQDLKLQIQVIIKEVIALDAQHKENIMKTQALIKGKIKDVMNRKVIQQAYYPYQRQSNGYFIDNKK